jgi:hypothetical protein
MSFSVPISVAHDAAAASNPSPARSTASNRFANIFRRPATPAQHTSSTSTRVRDGGLGGSAALTNGPVRRNKLALFWYYSIYPGDDRKLLFLNILESLVWRALLVVLTFILLFGAQIRDLAIPKARDTACDAIFTATFVFFVIDMLMRIDAEPTYFLCRCRGTERDNLEGSWLNNIQVGSFLFWCDLLSTITLLSEISFIYTKGFSTPSYTIYLDQYGMPVSVGWSGTLGRRSSTCVDSHTFSM